MLVRTCRVSAIVAGVLIAAAVGPVAAHAATTMTVVGTTVTIVGDAAPEVLVLDQAGATLHHNRAADPGFNSDIDFDSVELGDQTVPASPLTNVTVQLGAGPNSLIVQDAGATASTWSIGNSSLVTPVATIGYDASISGLTARGGTGLDTFAVLSTAAVTPLTIESGTSADNLLVGSAAGTLAPIAGAVRLGGGASTDTLVVNDSVGTKAGVYEFNQEPGRTTLARPDMGLISWDASVTVATLRAGLGNDVVTLVAPPATATVTNLDLGRGDDTYRPNGSTNLGGGTLVGGTGTDAIDFSTQTANVDVNLSAGTAGQYGPASSIEKITGTPSDDRIVGTPGDETIDGFGGRDALDGAAGDDTFTIVSGDGIGDTFVGSAGNDTLDLSEVEGPMVISFDGVGNDTIDGKAFGLDTFEVLQTGSGNDTIVGSAGPDTIAARDGVDVITGGGGSDNLSGGTDADRFVMGVNADGADVIDGGYDLGDTVDYSARKAAITVTLDAVASDGAKGEGDLVGGVINVLGGQGNDVLVGDRFVNQLVGGAGNDRLTGAQGNDTLDGGIGNDTISGGVGADKLLGGAGKDTVTGGVGKDVVQGGAGNDRLLVKAGIKDVDKVDGGIGIDTIVKDLVDKVVRVP